MLRYRLVTALVTASLPPRYRPRYRFVTALVTAPEKNNPGIFFSRKLLPQIKMRGLRRGVVWGM